MNKNLNKNLMLLTLALFLWACGPKVMTTKWSDQSLSNYETFAYLPNSNFDDLEKFETDNTVGESIIQRVNQNMKSEGYTMDRSNPDLLVLLSTTTDTEKTVIKEPIYATYPNYYSRNYRVSPYYNDYYYYDYNDYYDIQGYAIDVNKYKEGTLVVTLVDSETKSVVWQATASDFISIQNDSSATSKFIDDVFEEFPSAK